MTLRAKLILPLLLCGFLTAALLQFVLLPRAITSHEMDVQMLTTEQIGAIGEAIAPPFQAGDTATVAIMLDALLKSNPGWKSIELTDTAGRRVYPHAALRKARDELEARVEERTQELFERTRRLEGLIRTSDRLAGAIDVNETLSGMVADLREEQLYHPEHKQAIKSHVVVAYGGRFRRVVLLDTSVLEKFRERERQDRQQVVSRIVGAYLRHSPQHVEQLFEAVGGRNAAGIQSAAHTLKSSSANIGAMGLSALCEEHAA